MVDHRRAWFDYDNDGRLDLFVVTISVVA